MNLLIYVPLLSPRIKYIFSFIFSDILKTEVEFTVNVEEFSQSALPKFSYAERPIDNELFFKSTKLLFEHKIITRHIKTTNFGETKVPFPVNDSILPFDIFAASFYFLSRYEEYIHLENQKNEPYLAENSLQYKLKLLKTPIIDNWALILKNILLKQFPDLIFGDRHFHFQPVYVNLPKKKSNHSAIVSRTINYIRTFIDHKLYAKGDKIAGIKQFISDMQHSGSIKDSNFIIPDQHNEHRLISRLHIPKSYIKLGKQMVKNDYSMYYPGYPGFRAGTCSPFSWYDLQMEKKTQLLLHPAVMADTDLLENKTATALFLQLSELISNVKLVNGDFYFLSLYNDIRPQ